MAFRKIQPTSDMREKATFLREGNILFVYQDDTAIRMETEKGNDPYVWRDGEWRKMRG